MTQIAILAMAGRFPGQAHDPAALWLALEQGRDLIQPVPASRWRAERYHHAGAAGGLTHVSSWGGFLEEIDLFDPVAFGISPREAQTMDPGQRLLLEAAQRCWEGAGFRPSHWAGRPVGVFVGAFTPDYLLLQIGDREGTVSTVHSATGVTQTLLSNRLSYCWRLTGPSMTVDTACSSSLVAVHLAVNSLALGESELAFAGGVQLQLSPYYTAWESRGGFLSPDGRCRAFDHRANGYVRSEAVGLTLLAPLERALAEGWPVLAVIGAAAVNQNGGSVGVTFPSADAQAALITANLDRSGLSPDAIGFAEAHGTGTKAGDRAELLALGKTLGHPRRNGPLLVGSVKTNMGHAEAAAGISGLIKSVLSMRRGVVPRHLHWERGPEDLSLDDLGLRLPLEATDWPDGQPYASVSAFGFGGTNAHVVIGPAPQRRDVTPARSRPVRGEMLPLVALLSGPTADHLPLQAGAFADFLETQPASFDVASACAAMVYQRDWGSHGLAIVAETRDALIVRLRDYCRRPEARAWIQGAKDVSKTGGMAWVFSGMGPQWRDMGDKLAAAFPVFAETLRECDGLYKRMAGRSLLGEIAALPKEPEVLPARLAQPINLFFQIALARLLMSFGLHPDRGVCGHSVGEIAAFHIAGAIDLETAITLIFHRARLLGKLSGYGGMAAVSAGEEVVAPLAQAWGVCLAAINSASAVTVSGDGREIAALLEDLRQKGIHARMLDVDVPYHSALTEQLEAEFRAAIKDLRFSAARLPLHSTVTGGLLDEVEALEFGEYWWRNMREKVAFLPAFRELVSEGTCAVLEISAHPVLSAYMQETLESSNVSLIRTLRRHYSEVLAFAECLGRVQVSGTAQPDWSALFGSPAAPGSMPVPLPGFQWNKARYWAESNEKQRLRLATPTSTFLGYARSETPDVWDVDDVDLAPFALTDHIVLGQPRMPMAAFIEMMHAALRQSMPEGTVNLSRLRLYQGVVLSDEAGVRLTTRLDKKSGMVSIWRGEGTLVAEAHCIMARPRIVFNADQGEERSPQLDGSRDWARQSANEFYGNLAALGFDYGPAFRGLRWVRTGPAEAVGLIDGEAVAGCFISPAVLDAGLQVMLALEFAHRHTDGLQEGRERLPVSIADITLNRAVSNADFPLTARAILVRRNDRESVADLELRAADGALIARLRAVTAQVVPMPSALRGGRQPKDLVVSLEWKPVDERSLPLPVRKPRRWLIWRDRGGLAAAFGAYLTRCGENVLLADAAVLSVDALRRFPVTDNAEPLTILDFQPLDWQTLGPIEQIQELALFGRHCAEQTDIADGASEFWLITRDAWRLAAPDPIQSALWGLGRTLIDSEGDGNWRGLVDLEDTDIGGWPQALFNLVNSQPAQSQFLRRDGLWWVPDLVRASAAEAGGPVWLRPDASYIVTGAFGALGRVSAEYLVDCGARFLALFGQSELPPRSAWENETDPALRDRIDWLKKLEGRGVKVLPLAFDLADFGACGAALKTLKESGFPAARGIVHSAGAISDRPLRETRRRDFDHVFGVKVLGLLNLIDALDAVYSDDAQLDLCLVHSSVSGLFPAYGQSAYAAANCYLDAFVRQLEMRGVPALSIGWGPWSIGMAASDRLAQFFGLHGLLPITPEEGRQLLADLASRPRNMLYCAGVDWAKFAQSHRRQVWMFQTLLPEDRRQPWLAKVVSSGKRAVLSKEQRYRLALEDIADCAAQISGLPASAFTDQDVLARKGIDSLMAVELQILLAERWGREFPLSDILGRSNLGRLADQMAANTA
ncbi:MULTISPECIES: type I polyketide synthase [unclassified Rhizobium]|uniref:type I polyketide synthase n=1 Tax=unclassified Rhizobium TaxID=2613769 RepID=UPI000EA8BC86|nr:MULTISPECIES: type I polyketide synthase [unclassified Rhizobium]AYG70174.1 SDR family NAD(P)-dependent oxidoreductase [Rhizobium sp. CCGE531]AYG76549.1 SDR family NAD(P)-dependent oxidoreductase [Rhizobium sp. CCGE532]